MEREKEKMTEKKKNHGSKWVNFSGEENRYSECSVR